MDTTDNKKPLKNPSKNTGLKVALSVVTFLMITFLTSSVIMGLLLVDGTMTTIKTNMTRDSILEYINSQYIGSKPNDRSKSEGELKGLVSSLNDPYSQYLTEKETEEFRSAINEEYEGIGVRFAQKDKFFVITQVMDGSPAEKAGVQAEDILLKIGGEDVSGKTLDEVVTKIKGPKGTKVSLTFMRGDEEKSFEIERDAIKTELVDLKFEDSYAIITISSFGDEMYSRMQSVASEIKSKSDIKGIIIDLRSNTGGILNAGIIASSYFIDEGDVVAYEVGTQDKRTDKAIKVDPSLKNYPVAILVDKYTASASEIMAAAIKENRKDEVIVVGENTFGKGVVQQLFNLPDGGTLKLTVAEWLTPDNNKINKVGIKPDVETKDDEALPKAKEELAKKIQQ